MSASGLEAACGQGREEFGDDFSPLAYLLHALNQPLTGLQCSLELAVTGARTSEQYLRVLEEALELTARMRVLVEALREVTDVAQDGLAEPKAICLDALVREAIADLRPVAESRSVCIELGGDPFPHLCAVRRGVTSGLFRLLESALSLAASHSVLGIRFDSQPQQAAITACWTEESEGAERSPFSPQELGLLVARAAWQRAGGQWESERSRANRTVIIRLPWAASDHNLPTRSCGDCR